LSIRLKDRALGGFCSLEQRTNSPMKICKIFAVTLMVENMEKSCRFYSQIPGFKLVYGDFPNDTFTTFKIGGEEEQIKICLNLERAILNVYRND
jgi:hypothetical protein